MSLPDIVLFPHCDLHVALNGAPNLIVRVALRTRKQPGDPDPLSYNLNQIPLAQCHFDFFSPNAPTGDRLKNLPTVNNATGVVTANTPGMYLFQLRFGQHSLVGRLQVHTEMLRWWFGNSSITTAVDTRFAHAQPSIYASFTNENTITDVVGDITGHGYVPLVSSNVARFTVNGDGRLQGVSEGDDGKLSGTFLGVTNTLDVHVVDYAKPRNDLDPVRVANAANPSESHNILFIAEGFRHGGNDQKVFNEVVAKVVDAMFCKPRHQPYGLLKGSFNVWKAYADSQQMGVTAAFRVNDQEVAGTLAKGFPIPFDGNIGNDKTKYTVEELELRVGLPLANDPRTFAQLTAQWNGQGLNDFVVGRVTEDLVKAWRVQLSAGILEARDSFLGFRLGNRPGDRISRGSAVDPPAKDEAADAKLKPFIKRVYEFFDFGNSRSLVPDPRRHPPELFAGRSEANPGYAIMQYIGSLRTRAAPHTNVGTEWQPDLVRTNFKRSRGLVVVLTYDFLDGGSNVCDNTMTANTLQEVTTIQFAFTITGNERIMRRIIPDQIDPEVDGVINTVTHELGHSFALGDEYEQFGGNDPNANFNGDIGFDNVSRLGGIFLHGVVQQDNTVVFQDDLIDPGRVKWFDLMRMQASATLIANVVAAGADVKVAVNKASVSAFVKARKSGLDAFLRAQDIAGGGQQLPLKADNLHFLQPLTIGEIDEAQSTIVLKGAGLPAIGSPVFQKGAVLFVPKRNKKTDPVSMVVETKVLDHIKADNHTLNKDPDTAAVNSEADEPVDIDGFKPPCKAYKVIGIYEGAGAFAGRNYRPAGLCKMRKQSDKGKGDGEFCHVCKWLIVNRVDPSLHAALDRQFYPTARKGGNG